jgi:predicted metal-dependent hydrolase
MEKAMVDPLVHDSKGMNVKESRFDPFSNRLSRDIRNGLSQALVRSLDAMDAEDFTEQGKELLGRDMPPAYREYVRDRLTRYQEAFSEIERKRVNDGFEQVIILWNRGLFFEVHDRLESLWNGVPADTRRAYKAFIKAAAVHIHLEYGHVEAAMKLAKKAACLLRECRRFLPAALNVDVLIEGFERLDFTPPKLAIDN